MKKLTTILFINFILIALHARAEDTKIVIYADSGKVNISRHIYGHFSEHLGRCIYDGVWVGADSEIPNINGYNKAVVEALKEIAIPNLRWPGGCFADTYHWKDGIGPRETRPEIVNVHWGGVTENNSFGTHEFLEFCALLGCEPVICGNVGSGTVREMSEWVEYINSDALSPMTRLRKANGQDKPWKVKFWGVGNENWGCGGTMTADFYSDQLRQYGTYCRDYGENKLFRIAGGANVDDYNWTDVIMKDWHKTPGWLQGYMQGLSLHYYTVCHDWSQKGSAINFAEEDWFISLSKTYYMETLVTKHDSIMTRYDPDKKIALVVDEWGNWHDVEPGTNPGFLYQQNTLRDALVAAINLNIFNNHSDRVRMANIAQMVNVLQSVILTDSVQLVRTPTFYVFKLYKPHHDAKLLPYKIQTENYSMNNQSIPAVTASASRNAEGTIHLSLTNAFPDKKLTVNCDLRGVSISKVRGEIITGSAINSYNDFGKPEQVTIQPFKDARIQKNIVTVTLPARSVVMLELN